jgi:hypothetical protein
LWDDWNFPPLIVLRFAGTQPDNVHEEVDMVPSQFKNLTLPHCREVAKRERQTGINGERQRECVVLWLLDESVSRGCLFHGWEVGHVAEPSILARDVKHLLAACVIILTPKIAAVLASKDSSLPAIPSLAHRVHPISRATLFSAAALAVDFFLQAT